MLEVAGFLSILLGKDSYSLKPKCYTYCKKYVDKHNLKKGCSCCTCTYNTYSLSFGYVNRINYEIYSVIINPNTKCGTKGFINKVIILEPTKEYHRVKDPITNNTIGKLFDEFNV